MDLARLPIQYVDANQIMTFCTQTIIWLHDEHEGRESQLD